MISFLYVAKISILLLTEPIMFSISVKLYISPVIVENYFFKDLSLRKVSGYFSMLPFPSNKLFFKSILSKAEGDIVSKNIMILKILQKKNLGISFIG